MAEIKDKHGNQIEEGDEVWTKLRGGRREGEVGINLLLGP